MGHLRTPRDVLESKTWKSLVVVHQHKSRPSYVEVVCISSRATLGEQFAVRNLYNIELSNQLSMMSLEEQCTKLTQENKELKLQNEHLNLLLTSQREQLREYYSIVDENTELKNKLKKLQKLNKKEVRRLRKEVEEIRDNEMMTANDMTRANREMLLANPQTVGESATEKNSSLHDCTIPNEKTNHIVNNEQPTHRKVKSEASLSSIHSSQNLYDIDIDVQQEQNQTRRKKPISYSLPTRSTAIKKATHRSRSLDFQNNNGSENAERIHHSFVRRLSTGADNFFNFSAEIKKNQWKRKS